MLVRLMLIMENKSTGHQVDPSSQIITSLNHLQAVNIDHIRKNLLQCGYQCKFHMGMKRMQKEIVVLLRIGF